MITNVQQAIYPLLLICSVFGMGIYSPKKFYLNILYNLTVWTSYGYLYYYVITTFKAEMWLQSISNIIYIWIGVLTSIIVIIMSVHRDKKFRLFMKRLTAIDDTLEELGTSKRYQKLHTCAKRVLIGWLVCSYSLNIFESTWWIHVIEDHWCIIIPYIINHFYHVNMLMDLLFMTLLWYIGTRFDKINGHTKYLVEKKEYKLKKPRKNIVTTINKYITDDRRVLWILMHLHLELCQIARELNTIFGPQMTMEMAAYLVYVARMCNYILMHIITKGRYVPSLSVWIAMHFNAFIHLARVFGINYIYEKISAKASEMEKIIHQLTDYFQYDIHDEIYQFSLQIIHHPLKFTGLGLFYFGNNFVRKFVTTITTFLIFMVQMSIIPKTAIDF